MIFSRSKRSSKDDENIITTNATILAPQSSLSTKGALKIVDKWVQSPDTPGLVNDTPGPGAYNINDSFKKNKVLKFSTKTESKKREYYTPGPGAYASDSTASTLIKKSFNTYHHLPLYKLNNNDDNNNDKLIPTRVQGIKQTAVDTIIDKDVNVPKLRTRKEIKDTMLSLRSFATTGEIDDN